MVLEPSAVAILRAGPPVGQPPLARKLEVPRESGVPRETRVTREAGALGEARPSRETSAPGETRSSREARAPGEVWPSGGAAALRDPVDSTPRRNGRPLTRREREILSLVASGTSNKGIARALAVSANTVKFHLAAVFDKLNAATRAEAVAEAIRRGQISL
jgi:ATP/maltotriose-dependent transcriptional regulator MalT